MTISTSESIDPTHVQKRYVPKNFVGSSHTWASAVLDSLPSISSALDIGPGSGILGQELASRGVKHICGVEIDADTRENLKGLYTQVEADLEPFKDRKFSLLLCMDVLEHMSNPFEFLEEATRLLEPGGHVLISLPNIAHWSVRLPLLFGFFEYQERGLLDQTHLQLFTRKRALRLVKETPGLQIKQVQSSIEPLELLLPEWFWKNKAFSACSQMRVQLANILPGLMAYQHLILAQSHPSSL